VSKKRDEKKLSKRKHKRRHKETDEWLVSLSIAVEGLEEYVYQQRDTSVTIDFDGSELRLLSELCKREGFSLTQAIDNAISKLIEGEEKSKGYEVHLDGSRFDSTSTNNKLVAQWLKEMQ
jgi:hypothetical protein